MSQYQDLSRDQLVDRLEHIEQRLSQLEATVEELANPTSTGGSEGISKQVWDRLLPVHRTLLDYNRGRVDPSGSELRAMFIFRSFVRSMDPKHSLTGVESSHGTMRMVRDRAEHVLDDADHPEALTNSGNSTTIKRAMQKLARESARCECDGRCGHEMFEFRNQSTYTIAVNAEEWEEYLEWFYAAVQGDDVSLNADDAEQDSVEDSVEDQWEMLSSATTENTNTAVSKGSAGVLDGGHD